MINQQKINEKYGHNVNNKHGNNGFIQACQNNINLDVIKYLSNDLRINVNQVNNHGYNGFTLACYNNENIDVIKYLANNLKININQVNHNNNNSFSLVCMHNKNGDIIKYLMTIEIVIKQLLSHRFHHKQILIMKKIIESNNHPL